jgi:RNA polymerase sigma-70 factor (ECF subfamily)
MEKLVEENLPWLTGWLRGRLGDPELVHDVCQESFLKALKSVSRLKDISRFPAWLYRIAENTLRDHLRGKARRGRWLQLTNQLEERGAESRVAEELDAAEEAERLLLAVRSLPSRYREPLLLRHARDLSYVEIGTILGISENAVQVRIFRARQMLKGKLGGALKGLTS